MSSLEISHIDLEQGNGSDVSVCFSDVDEGSCYSRFYSTAGGSYHGYYFDDGGASDSKRVSSVVTEIKVHLDKVERDCRICHLGLESNSHESGVPIELGCSCKNDLAAAHKHCAETWFKIRGNMTCEICQSIARNVVGANEFESTDQANDTGTTTTASASGPAAPYTDTRSFWHGHRILNFLLACMVFAFVISWLFHFNMPSS